MKKLIVRKVGNSLGAIFPAEVLAALQVGEGDVLYLTSAPDGVRLTPYNPEFERQMEVAHAVMKRRRNVLRALAK
jgi:putative addiction module antidote